MTVFLTVRPTTGGNHGHQLKDFIGGMTIARLFGFTYAHSYHHYLAFTGIGDGEARVEDLPTDIDYISPYLPESYSGADLETAQKAFGFLHDRYADRDALLAIERSFRIFPHQTVEWASEGRIDRDVMDETLSDLSVKYRARNRLAEPEIGDNRARVAVHINGGIDHNPDRFPDHYESPAEVRYLFPMSYYEAIITQLREHYDGNVRFDIYTESLNSESVTEAFGSATDTTVHLGPNRGEGNMAAIQSIFAAFVDADVLVSCNSSFSAAACYFRHNKLTIYHPHRHLRALPSPWFVASSEDGAVELPDRTL